MRTDETGVTDPKAGDTGRKALAAVGVAALALVVLAPAAASWHGLVATGRDVFDLRDGWEYVVPLTLDGAALYAGALSIRAILKGDSAFGARFLTALYALAAAGFNGFHALTTAGGNVPAALFFAGASLSAVVLWDVTLRALRRDQLRAAGLIEKPLPRFRGLRWVVAPRETARAWRLAVVEQIHDPAEALHRARALAAGAPELPHRAIAERVTETPALAEGAANDGGQNDGKADDAGEERRTDRHVRDAAGPVRPGVDRHGRPDGDRGSDRGRGELVLRHGDSGGEEVLHGDLQWLSKADALCAAFDHLGKRKIPAALELLAAHGVTVDRSYAYTVKWTPPAPKLHAVGGEQ